MDEMRKASILLRHLPSNEREQILGRFNAEQREPLERMLAEATEVSHAELVDIVSEYQSWLQRISVNHDAEPESSATARSGEIPAEDCDGFRQLGSKDVESIVNRLIDEPATVLAAVLCQLHESTARGVYESLSEDRKAAVVARLPAQKELKPTVKQELGRFLSESAEDEPHNPRSSALLARLVGS